MITLQTCDLDVTLQRCKRRILTSVTQCGRGIQCKDFLLPSPLLNRWDMLSMGCVPCKVSCGFLLCLWPSCRTQNTFYCANTFVVSSNTWDGLLLVAREFNKGTWGFMSPPDIGSCHFSSFSGGRSGDGRLLNLVFPQISAVAMILKIMSGR
jgi:hypothetical protein